MANDALLWQGRMSQPSGAYSGAASTMPGFAMAFRPDAAAAAAAAAMPLLQRQPHQYYASNASAMPSNGLIDPYAVHNTIPLPATTLGPTYQAPSTFSRATFGSLSWPVAPLASSLPPAAAPPSFYQTDSQSSSDSETYIKTEEDWPTQEYQLFSDETDMFDSPKPSGSPEAESSDESKPTVFSTDIDTLMRTIQCKTGSRAEEPPGRARGGEGKRAKKRYMCEVAGCGKAFYQKTHLDIHTRAHTGCKPFVCRAPNCGQRFSQLGNLKTHERRHTGERPYTCDLCGKTFAQHGNVRAHKIVHTAAKPYTCRLDACQKQFTQLGNLKAHQNKFHVETIRRLRERFAGIREGDVVDSWEKEMWEYFGGLYRNSNKGIKGRGKDRRIRMEGLEGGDGRRGSEGSAGGGGG